jgi:DNA-binding CsgD family transcriptional regulator
VVTNALPHGFRALLMLRQYIDGLVTPYALRIGKSSPLSPRELAVLRLLSIGKRILEFAEHLAIGIKRAQAKLGAENRTHAVAEAMRCSPNVIFHDARWQLRW